MASILVFSERANLALELLGKAKELGGQMGLEVVAAAFNPADAEPYRRRSASKVFYSDQAELKDFEASVYSQALAQIAQKVGASLILLGSTRRGKELAGRLAQRLRAGCLTDVKSLDWNEGKMRCVRNAYGGATEATQVIATQVQVIALMPRAYEPAPEGEKKGEIITLKLDLKPSRIKVLKKSEKDTGAADIQGAEILVCVGKGLARQEDLKMIEDLAQTLGGLVACTKPLATDLKWLPESRIVGLSGKIGKPRLALCLGISGQVQFSVGIREAKTIMAINTDPNAYIFQITDYGLIADLHQAVPQLTAAMMG
ncbi:MAG TPA: electron transfer flavoprotein subunit alpha/FixB family protein [Thermodesulfobacteriota bacterium]|nr:electron transfer flavoprotein subunit alpha/FixB family protein [Thermodesulfobacteriota bacterium]